MANIDRIEELMCKHSVDAMGLGDEYGHYNGKYEIDGNHLLEILEQAECVEELEDRNKELEHASMHNGELNEFLQKRKLPPKTLGRHVVDVVMDYVEELERESKLLRGEKGIKSVLNDKAIEIIENKERQNKRYKQALEDIRDITTGSAHEFAKEALAGEPNETKME